MKNFPRNLSLVCCLAILVTGHSYGRTPAQVQPLREYQVKAVFLFNFTRFVEWPATAFEGSSSPLVVGILGSDPFGPFLEEAIRNESSNGHPLVMKKFRNVEDIDSCHMLFIHTAAKSDLKTVLEKAESAGILTVGDAPGFAEQGGMIQFVTRGGKTRIRINLAAAKAAGLTISSKLLGLAEIVGPDDD